MKEAGSLKIQPLFNRASLYNSIRSGKGMRPLDANVQERRSGSGQILSKESGLPVCYCIKAEGSPVIVYFVVHDGICLWGILFFLKRDQANPHILIDALGNT